MARIMWKRSCGSGHVSPRRPTTATGPECLSVDESGANARVRMLVVQSSHNWCKSKKRERTHTHRSASRQTCTCNEVVGCGLRAHTHTPANCYEIKDDNSAMAAASPWTVEKRLAMMALMRLSFYRKGKSLILNNLFSEHAMQYGYAKPLWLFLVEPWIQRTVEF